MVVGDQVIQLMEIHDFVCSEAVNERCQMMFNNTTANFTSTTQMKRATWLICDISRTIKTAAEFVYVT